MDLTLDQLLGAIDAGLMKSAEDKSDDKEKGDKEDKKELPAFMKKDGDKDDDKSDKKEDKDEKSDDEKCEDEGQTKKASESGAALYREVMEKIASTNLGTGMNKQASTAGAALARALMAKQASQGDLITTDGINPGSTPNKNQVDNAAMESEGASYIKPMPTGNGIENSGTVNEIFDAMVADVLSQGATGVDQVNASGVASAEGAAVDAAVPNQVKVAAMNELLEAGVDFDEAAEFIKEAGATAALSAAARGVGTAAGSVTGFAQAAGRSVGRGASSAGKAVAGKAKAVGNAVSGAASDAKDAGKVLWNPKNSPLPGVTRMDAAKSLARNHLVQGGAAAGALGAAGGAYALGREKKAAVDALCEYGVEFDQAVALVNDKAAELYGE